MKQSKLLLPSSQRKSDLNAKNLFQINWGLIFCTLVLASIGLINLYSASSVSNDEGIIFNPYFHRQLLWGGIGIVAIIVVLLVDYHRAEILAFPFYLFVLALLIAVHLIGVTAGGAKRWLDLGFMNFQPSELAKFAVIVLGARMLAERDSPKSILGAHRIAQNRSSTYGEVLSWRGLFKVSFMGLIPFVFVVTQPDLGTALMLLLILSGMILYHGVKWKILRTFLIAIPLALPIFWIYFLKDYQKQRVLTFLDPSQDPHGAGYHIIQSQIAIGSGEFLGTGFQQGTQSQLRFLPEKHTDFAIAVLGEEWGFVGTLFTVGFFCLFLYCIYASVRDAKDRFGSLLCTGIFFYFFWQILINIGMVIGIMPVVGMPLPFLSYGGTAMLVNCGLVGIVLNVSVRGAVLKD